MFENNLIPDPKWEPIPQIETSTIAKGGLGGAANAQALALLNNIEKTREHSVLVFDTLAEAQSAAATLPDGATIIVEGETQGHAGTGQYVPDSSPAAVLYGP